MSERYGQITKSERAMLEVMRTFRVMEKAQLSTYMKKLDFNKYDIANALDESKFNRKLFLEKDLFLHLKTFLKTVCRLRKQSG